MSEPTKREKIEAEVWVIITAFEKAAAGLFADVAGRHIHEYEGGYYGVEYGKPSRRLQTLLTIDREVLVLFTNFMSLQVRTVRLAETLIKESAGRLEPRIAIIVHRDEDGSNKLKNWGREAGLSILPVLFGKNGFEDADIERLLCTELYSHNPFEITGAVSDDSQFFGRRTEAQNLARQLKAGQVRACLGFRKMGKTSILNRVVRELERDTDVLVLFIDASRDDIAGLRAAGLIGTIAANVRAGTERKATYLTLDTSLPVATGDTAELGRSLVNAVSEDKRPVVLLFDEVDYLTPSSPTAGHWKSDFNVFWRNFRVACQEVSRLGRTLGIMVSGVSSRWFRAESIDGIENAALMFVPEEYLGPLPRRASIEMIKRLSRTAGLQFDASTAGLVAECCADVPLWIRTGCSYLHRRLDVTTRPFSPTKEQVGTLLTAFARDEGAALAEVALRHLLRIHPDLKDGFVLFGQKTLTARQTRVAVALEGYGLLKNDGSRQLNGDLVREGLRLLQEAGAQEESTGTVGAATPNAPVLALEEIGEWAEELAQIGRRRNIVERRLRELTLNFLRFDSLGRKEAPTAAARISQVLDEASRKRLGALPAEELIKKLLWTDLVKLIVKEWGLFEKVFGDQARFKQNADIVNDRPDAHAKDVDAADVALYRRSLRFLEEALDKVK